MRVGHGDFPVQLATRLPDWSAGGLLRCSAARLSVCRVVLQSPRARHARLVADILARMSRGCHEENCSRGISAYRKSVWRALQVVCDNVDGKRQSSQLEIAANATCCEVIALAMQTFGIIYTQHPRDYSLIQIDRLTKGASVNRLCAVYFARRQNQYRTMIN